MRTEVLASYYHWADVPKLDPIIYCPECGPNGQFAKLLVLLHAVGQDEFIALCWLQHTHIGPSTDPLIAAMLRQRPHPERRLNFS